MQFEAQTITIKTTWGERDVLAQVADQTGLAYHKTVDDEGYTITHLASGREICGDWYAETEDVVKLWLDRLLLLADWTPSLPQPHRTKLGTLLKFAIIGALADAEMQGKSPSEENNTLEANT